MKSLFKNSKLLAVILAITVLLSQASLVSASAQEANNEQEAFVQQQLNQIENLEENEWKPYFGEERFEDVFVVDPTGQLVIKDDTFSDNMAIEQKMGVRGVFSTLAALFGYLGFGYSYNGAGRGTWTNGYFYVTGHGGYGGAQVFLYYSNGQYYGDYTISCIG